MDEYMRSSGLTLCLYGTDGHWHDIKGIAADTG